MEQEEILDLTNNVYKFKEALKKLMDVFLPDQENKEKYVSSTVHERLSSVLRILKKIIDAYPEIQSTEMLLKAQNLIFSIQEYDPDDEDKNRELHGCVSQLATAFSLRTSEYLMDAQIKKLSHKHVEKSNRKYKSLRRQKTEGDKVDLQATMTTFGIDLDQHLFQTGKSVPLIVCKCIEEIDKRGLLVQGIYRVSGLKSRIEKLCHEFEVAGDKVDLSDIHPHIIANVLKLYLRQLPQPLFTNHLYSQFVRFSKDWTCNTKLQSEQAAKIELRKILQKLPTNYYATVTMLIQHLKRVADQESVNNMSPSNLGIVFGPTLLRNSEDQSCLLSLLDTVYQTRLVELIISWANELFEQ